MSEYDITRAFKRIENDLMDSMMRNMKKHQVEEKELGITWEQWQTLQLKELERYRLTNAKLFDDDFKQINRKIEAMFQATCDDAQSEEEARLLDLMRKGKFEPDYNRTGEYFNLNDKKLNTLITATKGDFTKAEYAMLRRANDIYRQVIFDAMTYANITNDYKKAVDMATHDFLLKGINCIQYKNGARHTMQDYASMAIRTGNKRAYLMGEGNAHDKLGLHVVRVNKRTHACPLCVRFLGKLLIDDVYGGGTDKEASELGIPTLSQAMDEGFLHPNCKDMYSVYIEGVSQPAKAWSRQEIEEIVGEYNQEQQVKHAEDMAESYGRLSKYSLDEENQQRYQDRADYWQGRADELRDTPAQPVPMPEIVDDVVDAVADNVADTIDVFVPAKTIQEAEAYAKSLGLEGSYKGVELDVANAMNESFKRGIEYCPAIKERMQMVGSGQERNKLLKQALTDYYLNNSASLQNARALGYTEKQIEDTAKKWASKSVGRITNAYAFASDTSMSPVGARFSGIFVNNKYAKFEEMTRMLERDVLSKFHPEGTASVKAVFDHEMAHQLDYALDLRKDAEMVKLFGSYTKAEIKEGLSEYGTRNIQEFIAEGYAEYLNNPQPRDIAQKVGKIIEERAKK